MENQLGDGTAYLRRLHLTHPSRVLFYAPPCGAHSEALLIQKGDHMPSLGQLYNDKESGLTTRKTYNVPIASIYAEEG